MATAAESHVALTAFQDLERRIVAVRTIAATDRAFEAYKEDIVPPELGRREEAMLAQGFAAGYAAAVKAISTALTASKAPYMVTREN